MDKKRLYIVASVILLSVILAVVSWFVLPDMVAVQINMQGNAGNTVPKLIGILIPLFFSVVFSVLYYKNGDLRHLLISVLGIVIGIVFIFFNIKIFP